MNLIMQRAKQIVFSKMFSSSSVHQFIIFNPPQEATLLSSNGKSVLKFVDTSKFHRYATSPVQKGMGIF